MTSAHAARVERVNQAVDGALRTLYGHAAGARALRDKATAVLVFLRIVKTGSASGERRGAAVLREHGISTGYYRSLGVFHGVEPGIESFDTPSSSRRSRHSTSLAGAMAGRSVAGRASWSSTGERRGSPRPRVHRTIHTPSSSLRKV
jgi:hypothetical protein